MSRYARALTKEIELSSPATDYDGICSIGTELVKVGEQLTTLGYTQQRRVLTDASSARATAVREGVSGVRRLETTYLWKKLKEGKFQVEAAQEEVNPADTHP